MRKDCFVLTRNDKGLFNKDIDMPWPPVKNHPRGNSRLAGSAESWTKLLSHSIPAEWTLLHLLAFQLFHIYRKATWKAWSWASRTASHTQHVWQACWIPWFHRRRLGEKQRQMNSVTPKKPQESCTTSGRDSRQTERKFTPSDTGVENKGKQTEISQSYCKGDNHQKDPFPNFDPGEKLPRQSAKMFGKSMRSTKIKYIEHRLLLF